jgi:hypothetical protein
MVFVGADFEAHEIAEVHASCVLQLCQDVSRRPKHTQIQILGGARALETQLERETTFQRRRNGRRYRQREPGTDRRP